MKEVEFVSLFLLFSALFIGCAGGGTSVRSPSPPARYACPEWRPAREGDVLLDGRIVIEGIRKITAERRTAFEVIFRNAGYLEVVFEARGVFLDAAGTAHVYGPVKWQGACLSANRRTVIEFEAPPGAKPPAGLSVAVRQ